jgi:chromosome segregation ATPase
MNKRPLDFAAARADLHTVIAANAAALETVRNRLGELALDVTLGNSPQTELDTANAELANLQSKAAALVEALSAVDRREAEHAAAQAEKQRKADEKRLAALQGICDAAGVKVVDLATQLRVVLVEGRDSAEEVEALGRKLGVNTVVLARWPFTAQQILMAHCGIQGGFMRPGEQEAAERSLTGQVV